MTGQETPDQKRVMTLGAFETEHARYELRRFTHADRLIAAGHPRTDVVRVIFPDRPEYLSGDTTP